MDVTPFGKYELLERIAAGGMAEVFLARATGLAGFERRLVIKRIREEHARDPRFVQSFVNEARIGVHLDHPNIVQVYELGRVGDAWYIAMEHLHGRDLTRLRKAVGARGERIPAPVAVRLVADVCRALAYAHTRYTADGQPLGLVHRDVSPHNVVVTFSGEVKLVDFGIARLMHEQAPAQGAGLIGGGKYAYMSPEQARGEPLDHRSDLFSAGIVLWELLVGHRLFQHDDPAEKLRRVQQAIIPHPADAGVAIDDDLWGILSTALSHDRDQRYAAAATMEEDLRAWLFATRERVERTHLAQLLQTAFPDEAARTRSDLYLHRLVADLERLDVRATDRGSGEPTTSPTGPDGPLPGRLPAPVGERKSVVVLIVDVDGLTELSARLRPEALFGRKLQLLRWVRKVVDAHGGLMQSTVDDHITLLFGVPRARADDLPRALQCALELARDVGVLRRKGMSLELCIGVHTGEVTVGQGGRRARVRYVARGDTTRLARRLSAVADHGQVLASQRVVERVEGQFDLRRGPGVPSRGGAPDLPSWQVRGRQAGLSATHDGPWVRRGRELAVMRDALLELSRGRGAAVALTGPTGSGKSRFLREIRDLASRRGLAFHAVRCTPLGRERPLEPLRDLVISLLGEEPDTPVPKLVEAAAPLEDLGVAPRDREVLLALLGARVRHVPARTETWQALRRLVRALTASRPLIIAFDDAHHLSSYANTGMARMAEVLRRVPVCVLLGHEGPVPAPLAAELTSVDLGPLEGPQVRSVVRHLLGVRTVGDELMAKVVDTCEGNPLYVQELLKYLEGADQLTIVDDHAECRPGELSLPPSLAALIAVRIDALDAAAKGALQLAAVAGVTFSEALLGEAAGLDDPMPLIQELAARNLVVRVPGTTDDWQLASGLVREAALRGTLGVQRRDYHRLIAAAIERLADDLEPWAEELMGHCAEGGRLVDAARYAFRAGQALEREQELDRAAAVYEAGLTYVARIEAADDYDAKVQGDAMLHLRLGVVRLLLGSVQAGRAALQLALDIAAEAGLPWIEVRAHIALGRHYRLEGPRQLARAHLDQARALLRLEDDPDVEREALEAAAALAFDEGRDDEATRLWNQAMASARDPVATARCQLGLATRHIRAGDLDRAAPLLAEALEAARQAGDRILEGRVLNNQGLLHSWREDHDRALDYYRAALELRQSIGYTRGVAVNQHNIGDVHLRRGDRSRAAGAFARSRDLARALGWSRLVVLDEVYLAYLEADDVSDILAAVEAARALGDGEATTAGGWLAGRWLAEHGQLGAARTHLERALAEAVDQRHQPMADLIRRELAALDTDRDPTSPGLSGPGRG